MGEAIKIIIGLLVAALLVLGGYSIYKKLQEIPTTIKLVKSKLMNSHFEMIKNKQYAETYSKNIAKNFKISKSEYIEAYKNREKDYGDFVSWEITNSSIESNIFNSTKFLTLKCRLQFKLKEEYVMYYIILNDEPKIQETYGWVGTSARFEAW